MNRTLRPATKAIVLAVAIAISALTVAGCGGSSPTSTTTSSAAAGGSAPSTTATSNKLEQFAQCMRSHGAANFPDPTAQGTFNVPAALTASPQFHTADYACKSLAPPGPLRGQAPTTAQLTKALNFVHCMRKQGVNLSDPTAAGTFHQLPTASEVNSPQFKQALYGCRSLLPAGNGFGTGH